MRTCWGEKWITVYSFFKLWELEKNIAFLPRHGKSHNLLPSNINYRANIDCLKSLGVTDIISLSAVGSLKESIKPGDFVVIDQFIDRTFARIKTFFNDGIVAHVSMAKPTSKKLSKIIFESAPDNINILNGGTYIAMEGPQFSTLAESNLYRSWNCDVTVSYTHLTLPTKA